MQHVSAGSAATSTGPQTLNPPFVHALAPSKDGSFVAAAVGDSSFRLLRGDTLTPICAVVGHRAACSHATFTSWETQEEEAAKASEPLPSSTTAPAPPAPSAEKPSTPTDRSGDGKSDAEDTEKGEEAAGGTKKKRGKKKNKKAKKSDLMTDDDLLDAIISPKLAPGSTTLITSGNDGTINVWDVQSLLDAAAAAPTPKKAAGKDSPPVVQIPPLLSIKHGPHPSWVATSSALGGSILVADPTKALTVYHGLVNAVDARRGQR